MLSDLDIKPVKQPKNDFVLKPKPKKPEQKQCFYHEHRPKQQKPKTLKVWGTQPDLNRASSSSLSVEQPTLPTAPLLKNVFGPPGRNQSALSRLGGNFIAAHHEELVEMLLGDILKETSVEMSRIEGVKKDQCAQNKFEEITF